jgi:hypothetical protein
MTKTVRPVHEVVQGLLDEHFGFGIELGSGLVENQNRSILEQCAGDGEALALAAGEALAAVADLRLIALGKLGDEIVGQRGLGSGNHARFGQVGAAVAQIVPDRIVEEDGFLGDDGHLFAEGAQGDVANVVAVDAHAAGNRGVKSREKIDQGGLAGAAGTDDGNHRAGRDADVKRRAGWVSRSRRRSRRRRVRRRGKISRHRGARSFADFFVERQKCEDLGGGAQRLLE